MKTLAFYETLDKKFKIDITDIFSLRNDLKFELKVTAEDRKFVLNDYLLEEFCEDDEYLFYLVFDFKDICFEKIQEIDLIQFKNQYFSNEKNIYYFLKLV